MSAGQPAPPPPFRPSCIVCVSDCDAHGLFTSCHHFLCARCVAKYPQGSCPRCQKPCRTMPLNAPAIAERISADGLRAVSAAQQTAEFQRRQDGIALARLRELVGMFNEKHRQEATKAAALQAQVDQLGRENGGLKEALRQAQLQLQRSPQQQQQPRPSSYGTMSPNMGYDGPPPHHHHNRHHHQAPGTPSGHANPPGLQQQQQWQRAPSVGSAQSLFSAKRPRAPPTPTGPPGAGADRFMLATPAMTLRAGGGGGTPAMHDVVQRRPPQPPLTSRPGGGSGGGVPTTAATGGKTTALPPLRSMLPAAPNMREEHPRIPSACGESAPFAVPGGR